MNGRGEQSRWSRRVGVSHLLGRRRLSHWRRPIVRGGWAAVVMFWVSVRSRPREVNGADLVHPAQPPTPGGHLGLVSDRLGVRLAGRLLELRGEAQSRPRLIGCGS